MSQRCPVCKASLWREPILPRRLRCPRCGAVFRPTVHWAYFQFLLLFCVLLCLTILVSFFNQRFWLIVLFLLGVAGFFWHLPKLINLERVSGDFQFADGPEARDDDIRFKLKLRDWEQKEQDGKGLSWFESFCILLLLVLIVAILFRFCG